MKKLAVVIAGMSLMIGMCACGKKAEIATTAEETTESVKTMRINAGTDENPWWVEIPAESDTK